MIQVQAQLPVVTLIVAGLLSLVGGAAALWWRGVPGARPLALCCLATAVWSFSYGLELSSTTISTALRWATIQYIGIVVVPGSWLVFTARYSNHDAWLTRRTQLLLCVMPVLTLAAVVTNPAHGLFWSTIALVQQGNLLLLDVEHGPLFWAHAIYSYVCLLTGSISLLRLIIAWPDRYRSSLGALLVALAAPWVGNALYLLNLSPFGALDLTSLAFSISFTAITWSIIRLRLFNLIPIARGTVLEQMSDAVAVLDEQNQVADLNAAALHSLSLERPAAINRPAREVFARWPELITHYRQTVRADDELQVHDADGARWYHVRISPLFDSVSQLRGRLIVWRDITQEKQTLAALVEAKDAAEAASRAKSAFLANMSHELRTPLTAVLGYTQLMHMDLTDGIHQQLPSYAASIDLAGSHLLRLINNLLQIARIEADRVNLEIETATVEELVAEVVATVRPLINRQGNALVVECDESLGTVTTDLVKLRQVLLNLLDNAAKFTEHGQITLCVQREAHVDPDWLVFVVSDTGVGISEEELPLLFDVFTEPDTLKRRRFGGTGIGLALSRHLCVLMGGEIIVGAPSSAGSTFTVRLPATYEAPAPPQDGREGPL